MAAKRKSGNYSAPALEKGLDILELLTHEPNGLSLTEIAAKLDRSVGQIFRMLFVLEQRGYLNSDPASESYRLSLKLFQMAHQNAPVKRLTSTAAPRMRDLSNAMLQSCHLVSYYHGRCLVMVQKSSPGTTGFNVRLGAEIQLTMSCSGHVLLAFASEGSRKLMLAEAPRKERARVPAQELNKVLTSVRERGYELMDSAITHGVKDMGFPVFDHEGAVVASLTVPFLERKDGSNPVDLEQAVELLRACAGDISRNLGYVQEST